MSSLYEQAQDARVVIVGVGNTLLSDEGVGVHVVRRAAERIDAPGVVVVDGGTGGYGLVDIFIAARRVIVVDAMEAQRSPGEVLVFRPEELKQDETTPLSSLHGVGIMDVWKLARALGHTPPTAIVGVQVGSLKPGEELTAEVAQAVPRAVAAVEAELESALSEDDPR
jgi:hydrogenase maturation protease